MHRSTSPRIQLIAVAGAAVVLLGACTSAASPVTTFGPASSEPSATATALVTPEPTAPPTPTPVATPAPTPFIAGTVAAPRVIEVTMSDTFRFEPSEITVQAGETIRFELTNEGVIDHDFTIGDAEAQEHHAMEMMGGGMHHGSDANAALVGPGQTHDLTFTFGEPAEWLIGCHVPGHYEAGMKGLLHIVASMP